MLEAIIITLLAGGTFLVGLVILGYTLTMAPRLEHNRKMEEINMKKKEQSFDLQIREEMHLQALAERQAHPELAAGVSLEEERFKIR